MSSSLPLSLSPHFDGNNYAYLKVRMRAFLNSLNEVVWKRVETRWKHLEKDMTTEEMATCNANSRALNAIFAVVSPGEFSRIVNVVSAKVA